MRAPAPARCRRFAPGSTALNRRALVVAPLPNDLLDQLALGCVATLQRVNDRQRHFSLPQITTDRLTQHVLTSREIQDIVDQLESHPEIPGELAESLFLLVGPSARDDTNRAQAEKRPAVLRSISSM